MAGDHSAYIHEDTSIAARIERLNQERKAGSQSRAGTRAGKPSQLYPHSSNTSAAIPIAKELVEVHVIVCAQHAEHGRLDKLEPVKQHHAAGREEVQESFRDLLPLCGKGNGGTARQYLVIVKGPLCPPDPEKKNMRVLAPL